MSLLEREFTAVEHFAHELAAPLHGSMIADIEARTVRMGLAVDELVKSFAMKPGMSETQAAAHLRVIDGMVAMMSAAIDVCAADLKVRELDDDPGEIDAMIEAHDDMVHQYYRLMALRIDLDPECRPDPDAPMLDSPEKLTAWFDGIIAAA